MWNYLNTKEFDGRLMLIAGYLANKISGKTVLDLNCGYGRLADYLPQPANYAYVGNDIDEAAYKDFCERYADSKKHFFWIKPDDFVPKANWHSIDVLVCAGYAAKLNEHESQTLDETIKAIVRQYRPEIIILESALNVAVYPAVVLLADWIETRGYGVANYLVASKDVLDNAVAALMNMRHIIILEKGK